MQSSTNSRPAVVALLAIATFFAVVLATSRASAYPWMIRHAATQCGTCHADPSGSGLLTSFGRARAEAVMRTHWGEGQPAKGLGDFLFGVPTPDWLLLGGSVRNGYMYTRATLPARRANDGTTTPSFAVTDSRFLQMQADLRAQVTFGRFRANGGIGYLRQPTTMLGEPAVVHAWSGGYVVSREHWIGVDLGEAREWLVRAGRFNLPFGLRSNEHTMWTRATTRTDINDAQQHGVGVAYAAGSIRTEAMLVVGNLQIRPDAYREQGGVGYFEYAFAPKLAVGASALVMRTTLDPTINESLIRHAYGLFARWSPVRPVVVMGEGDVVVSRGETQARGTGTVSYLQVDVEPTQGVHVMVTGEHRKLPAATGTAYGAWFGAAWFFFAHTDVRFDVIYRTLPGETRIPSVTLIGQLHVFL